MNADQWGWWAGKDEEFFNYGGPLKSREQAIEAGRGEADGEGFWIVEARVEAVSFSAAQLIDAQYFENEDYFSGEHGEPDRLGDHAAADAELQTLLDAWVKKWAATFVQPEMFTGQRNLEFIAAEVEEPA